MTSEVTAPKPTSSAAPPPSFPFGRSGFFQSPPEFTRLRATAPVSRVVTADNGQAWLVTRQDDVRFVLSNQAFVAYSGIADSPFEDPSAHTRLRKLMSHAFTARRVERLRPRTREIAADLVTQMTRLEAPVDLVQAFALPLPIIVICELLGIPVADRAEFRRWADAILAVTACTPEEAGQAGQDLNSYMSSLIAEKQRSSVSEDLLSALIAVRDRDDAQLSDTELVTIAVGLIIAGYVTPSNAVGLAVIYLLAHQQLEVLRDNPALIPAAVEETLRYQSGRNGESMPRVAVQDVRIGGVLIRAGERVVAPLESANHDERRVANPERFDISRRENSHLAFGIGIHHCPGAALARVELQVAFEALARRVPRLHLAVPAEELPITVNMFGDQVPSAIPVGW